MRGIEDETLLYAILFLIVLVIVILALLYLRKSPLELFPV